MSSNRRLERKRRQAKRARKSATPSRSDESPPVEFLTVAWTVSVTAVLLCELIAVAANVAIAAFPPAGRMMMLEGLMIFSAGVSGVVSLALLVALMRVRRSPLPPGVVVFGAILAVVAIVALLFRIQ